MMNKQELERDWRAIQKILGENSFFVFPSTIEDGGDVVLWKGEQGVEAFLDLAKNLGVRLIYAEASI